MPVLSTFYGIIVRMYRETGGKHNLPHIHYAVNMGLFSAYFAFTGSRSIRFYLKEYLLYCQ